MHLVSGEEDGGVGAFATLRAGHAARACVIAEPTGGAVIPANAGSLTFRLEVDGRAAHGSTRTEGESASTTSPRSSRPCARSRPGATPSLPRRSPTSTSWRPSRSGSLRSGTWASTVPDLLVAEGTVRRPAR